jgi:hypothetical protein
LISFSLWAFWMLERHYGTEDFHPSRFGDLVLIGPQHRASCLRVDTFCW